MDTRSRNPLMLALLIALVPAVSLAVWLGPLRHAPSRSTAVASPAPLPVATASPEPTPLPQLAQADMLTLVVPHAYGRLVVQGIPPAAEIPAAGYALATTPSAFPTALPVWKLAGFAPRDTSGLAAALGLPVTGSPTPGDDLDAAHAAARATITRIPVTGTVRSENDAISAADTALHEMGVPPLNAALEVSSRGTAPNREWSVAYPRHLLDGVRVGLDPEYAAALTIEESGFITSVDIHEEAVDGGSTYPLRDWHEAWADVQHHRWAALCCPGPNGNPGGPSNVPGAPDYRLRVDRVYLYYEESQPSASGPDYLVPFYAFEDSRNQFSVGVPALRSADVEVQP
jgi:hypothetical protein